MAEKNSIKGIYRHYKGNKYAVAGEAMDMTTAEHFVLYRQMYEPFGYWLRPKNMFFEDVEVDGAIKPRFEKIGDDTYSELKDMNIFELVATNTETEAQYKIRSKADNIYYLTKLLS